MSAINKPFFYQTAWYCLIDRKRVYLAPGTPEEKARWKKGDRAKQFTLRDDVKKEWGKLLAHEVPQDVGDEMNVGDLAELFLADVTPNLHPANKRIYRSIIEDFVEFWGRRKLTAITPGQMRVWERKHPGWKTGSAVRSAFKKVLQMLNWAVSEKIIKENPVKGIKMPQDGKREIMVSAKDEKTILDNSHPRYADFVTACLQTGRRPNEIAKLKPKNVVTLHGGKLGLKFKGKNFKKEAKEETIPLNATMQKLVSERLEATEDDGVLFPTEEGVRYLETNWNRPMRTIARKHGTDKRITAYCFRHTYITRALMRGVPIATVARLVGNNVETLLRHYAHLDKEVAENLFDAVELATA